MANKTIYGMLELNEKEYPFVLEGQILTITHNSLRYSKELGDITHFSTIQGVTSKHRNIIFLEGTVLNSTFPFFQTEIIISVQGYVLLYGVEAGFDRIDFYSEAINAFYFPRYAYKIEEDEIEIGLRGIQIREKESYKKEFQCKIDDDEFSIGLDIYLSLNLALGEENIGTARTVFYMSFSEQKKPSDLPRFYLYLKDFLEFVNFRQDIPLKRIELFKKSEGRYQKRGIAVIFQKEGIEYKADINKSIAFCDISESQFPELFQRISEKRLHENYNPYFYPESKKEDKYLDASKWLQAAICFEGEFNLSFADFKSNNSPAFYQAKMKLLDTINEAVRASGKSINNKQNAEYKSFMHLIEHADTTIKEKFKVCQEMFEEETKDAIEKICRESGITEDVDLAQSYAMYRNQTAHGVVRKPEDVEIATYRILRCFIYTMNLKRAHVSSDEIKEIIKKMF